MKSFRRHIEEMTNSTANMLYATRDFSVDDVDVEFDVEDYPEERRKMRPWEVRNAEGAAERRDLVLAWLKAAGANTRRSVTRSSLPMVPKWQSRDR